ncbi:hypothetical protein [Posidoniimonas polymericola]|nr:hypothetical protein [Posidoniimonas polymericola]
MLLAPEAVAAPEGYEVIPSEIELTIGRSKHLVAEGVTSTVRINGRDVPVKVVRRPAKKLSVDSFSFSYPSSFTLLSSASAGDPESASWMLKGKTCQITVHRKAKSTTLSFLTDHMAEFYEGLSDVSDLSRGSATLTVRGKRQPGVRFTMKTSREGLTFHDYFQLPVSSSRYSYFLVIHSALGDSSEEQARSMIGTTLR